MKVLSRVFLRFECFGARSEIFDELVRVANPTTYAGVDQIRRLRRVFKETIKAASFNELLHAPSDCTPDETSRTAYTNAQSLESEFMRLLTRLLLCSRIRIDSVGRLVGCRDATPRLFKDG